MTRMIGLCAALTLACAGPFPARAVAESGRDALNRVRFEVERTRQVPHDRIIATVGVTAEDSESARLAEHVNTTMTWALERANAVDSVEAQTGRYQTLPVHEDGKIRRWRASQDLVLSSSDVEALTALLGQLQGRLLVREVSFGVSTEQQRLVHDELILECLSAYERRAQAIQRALSARGYTLVDLMIETPTSQGPGLRFARAQVFAADVAPPAFQAGETELVVRIQATIELEP